MTELPEDDFVGRESEVERIVTLLRRKTRLLTLVGPGGIGKTRLAAKACEQLRRIQDTPIYWSHLAGLPAGCDDAAVEEEIFRSVVATDDFERPMWEALVTTLTETDRRGRIVTTLLVLDNCEHVLSHVGRIIGRLLDEVPGLCIMTTSREVIGWVDEYRFAVLPLSPDQALTLFRYRAELTGHPITGREQLAQAASVCRRLDDYPLFIRLAAGLLVQQSLPMIVHQLSDDPEDDHRLTWLLAPSFGSDDRHRTIDDVVSWSYELCGDKEKLLFERMSVFASGYGRAQEPVPRLALDAGADLDAIRAVCADPDRAGRPETNQKTTCITADEIEPALSRLADQSLVSRHFGATAVYYSLSETYRVYALTKLRARSVGGTNEYSISTERHRQYYRDKVSDAAKTYFGPAERDLLDWAAASWDNVIIAIERSLAPGGNAVHALEICIDLLTLRLPFFEGPFRDMRSLTERALDATARESGVLAELRVTAMAMLVWVMLCQGATGDAEQLLDRCVRACTSILPADWRLASTTDLALPAVVDFAWGLELLFARKNQASIDVLDRAREKYDRDGNLSGAMRSQQFAALSAALLGPPKQARELASQYLERTKAVESSWSQLWAELIWSVALTRLGEIDEALAVQRSVLATVLPTGEHWEASWAIQFRAWSLARQITIDSMKHRAASRHRADLATKIALLVGGSRTLRARLGVDIAHLRPFADIAAETVRTARDVLGAQAFDRIEAQGAALRPESQEIYRLALGTLAVRDIKLPNSGPGDESAGWDDLTAAEKEVAKMAAAGLTNSAIAAHRGTSRRTVDTQVAAILQKLQIKTRAQITRFVPGDT
ncbi:ATP-binding protein [Nocardia blacklockiae]|uniref:ATP-binding protein n=1 Tax=Nocardia blacklockiae TaxID=480036 RepID=UPI001893B521|nr:LuxR C-terminal-related transcriptional regulator [Nocardia blacklockiae]MBF6171012.1 hypothetical protein [Nocardia blacklockiae]